VRGTSSSHREWGKKIPSSRRAGGFSPPTREGERIILFVFSCFFVKTPAYIIFLIEGGERFKTNGEGTLNISFPIYKGEKKRKHFFLGSEELK